MLCSQCIAYRTTTKLSFFRAPKDMSSRLKWEEALGIKNLSGWKSICEKHFREEDILWEKSFYNQDGTLFQKASYKIPRLRPNAIPLPCNAALTQVPEVHPEKIIKKEPLQIEHSCSIQNKKLNLEETDIKLQNVDIKLPPFWSTIHLKDSHFILFAKLDVTKAGDIVPSKEVRLTTYGEVEYRFYGKTVNITSLVTQIKGYQEMEEIIANFDIMGV